MYINKTEERMNVLHIGDSGYIRLRNDTEDLKIVDQSVDMLHGFNFPYQVGSSGDSPYSANVTNHEINEGDIIVLASDGLWDNVEIEDIVKTIEISNGDIKGLADKLGNKAAEISVQEDAETPFYKKSKKAGRNWLGGKIDDITVIVAKMVWDEHKLNYADL